MDELHKEEPDRKIAGFWRRLVAFAIDVILLGIAGMILGALFFEPFARLGAYAQLIGFAIALAYFGICNSRIGRGQTLGKRWLGVRVVDAHDQWLSLPRSLLRYTVLGLPFFIGHLPIGSQSVSTTPFDYLWALLISGSMLSTVYLYVFNRRTRQSLHDLVVGSYVEHFDGATQPAPFPVMWRGHLVALAVVAVIALSGPWLSSRWAQSKTFADFLPLYQTLSTQPHVMKVQVISGWSFFNDDNATHSLQSSLRLDGPMIEDAAMAKRIAQLMAKADPNIANEDSVVVTLVYGYDMGIASGWKKHGYSFKPGELH
jgi:uncharacterized RDD family membrane protein YckC